MLHSRTIVLGGARSGKSALAERLVDLSGKSKIYLATAQALDDEMRQRIELHSQRRDAGWTTIETPLGVATAIRAAAPGDAVLLDCATLWLSNVLLAGKDIDTAAEDLLAALSETPAEITVVSNETGLGVVPDTALGRRFREAQGLLNQRLAAWANLAVLVVAGLPIALKGRLPKGFP